MYSLRKWIFRPKRTDSSYLAQFFHSDEELNMVASELDSFDGRKDPERCNALVNQLRMCQDKVLTIVEKIMDEVIADNRANRDFRVKFPDDVLQESLAGQLWFGAECLAAGSSIMNREVESASMRPLAKALTRHLDYLRSLLRDQCLRNHNSYTDKIKEGLVLFDKLFAEFELSYVSAMVPVKTMKEYDILQEVIVLFSETTQRAMKLNLLTQDMIDDYDPALMFTIPRLAIICGLLIYPEGPLNPDMDPMNMSEMFRPFQTLLYKIRELLWTLSREELWLLEKALCSAEEPGLYRNYDPVTFQEDCDLADIPDWYYPPNPSSKTEASIGETLRTRLHRDNPFTGQLGADILEAAYGSMSQSPSIQTIVSNPNYRTEVDTLSESTLEEVESANNVPSVEQPEDGASVNKAQLVKQHSADSGVTNEAGNVTTATNAGYEGATAAAATDTRSLRHSLSWPESRRRGRTGRLSEGETQMLNYDADSLEEDNMVDPSLHLTASTHEFNFHLPLNTERVRPESSEHEYNIPTISAQRMTPSAPAPGGVSNLQRIFITSEQERVENENLSGLSQISFVTDALTDVFITDFNFSDSSKEGGKGSKVKNTRKKVGAPESNAGEKRETSGNIECENGQDQDNSRVKEGVSAKSDTEEVRDCDNMILASSSNSLTEGSSDLGPQPTTSAVEHLDKNDNNKCLIPVEDDVAIDDMDDDDYALSTESETDDYKASQKAAQAQALASDSNSSLNTENKSDDDKGAMIISKNTYIEDFTEQTKSEMVTSLEEKSETETFEKDKSVIVNSVSNVARDDEHHQSVKLHSESDSDCDKFGSDNSNLHKCVETAQPNTGSSYIDTQAGTSKSADTVVNTNGSTVVSPQEISRVQRLKYSELSNASQMYNGNILNSNVQIGVSDFDWDRESYTSSETSSYTSECQDDEEIALAIQAAELAARREARARFKSSADLIHRLFVCVSGVADQLQTNYASDLRHILKAVFECNASEPYIPIDVATATDKDQPGPSSEAETRDTDSTGEPSHREEETAGGDEPEDDMELPAEGAEEADESMTASPRRNNIRTEVQSANQPSDEAEPPKWVPDEQCPHCTGCKVPFTFVRRRHHCRNCGKVFCGRCSANSVPLPHYGHNKPVRVCNHCFMFQVTPFTMD